MNRPRVVEERTITAHTTAARRPTEFDGDHQRPLAGRLLPPPPPSSRRVCHRHQRCRATRARRGRRELWRLAPCRSAASACRSAARARTRRTRTRRTCARGAARSRARRRTSGRAARRAGRGTSRGRQRGASGLGWAASPREKAKLFSGPAARRAGRGYIYPARTTAWRVVRAGLGGITTEGVTACHYELLHGVGRSRSTPSRRAA